MIKKRMSHSLLVFISICFMELISADDIQNYPIDLVAPQIVHDPISQPLSVDQTLVLSATVTDNIGVDSVLLYYRLIDGAKEYQRIPMKQNANTDLYSTTLPNINIPGVEYYIQASDHAGNSLFMGQSFSPLHVRIQAAIDTHSKPNKETANQASRFIPKSNIEEASTSHYKWLWIGLSVIAVGALTGGGDGGGNSNKPIDQDEPAVTTISVDATVPGTR